MVPVDFRGVNVGGDVAVSEHLGKNIHRGTPLNNLPPFSPGAVSPRTSPGSSPAALAATTVPRTLATTASTTRRRSAPAIFPPYSSSSSSSSSARPITISAAVPAIAAAAAATSSGGGVGIGLSGVRVSSAVALVEAVARAGREVLRGVLRKGEGMSEEQKKQNQQLLC